MEFSVSVADVASFVAMFLLPALNGLLSSWLTEKWKRYIPGNLVDWVRLPIIRGMVAAICVALYVPEQYFLTGSIIDASTLPELFYSYVTAAASFDHLFKRK